MKSGPDGSGVGRRRNYPTYRVTKSSIASSIPGTTNFNLNEGMIELSQKHRKSRRRASAKTETHDSSSQQSFDSEPGMDHIDDSFVAEDDLDMNEDLTSTSWQGTFDSQYARFQAFSDAAEQNAEKVLREMQASTPPPTHSVFDWHSWSPGHSSATDTSLATYGESLHDVSKVPDQITDMCAESRSIVQKDRTRRRLALEQKQLKSNDSGDDVFLELARVLASASLVTGKAANAVNIGSAIGTLHAKLEEVALKVSQRWTSSSLGIIQHNRKQQKRALQDFRAGLQELIVDAYEWDYESNEEKLRCMNRLAGACHHKLAVHDITSKDQANITQSLRSAVESVRSSVAASCEDNLSDLVDSELRLIFGCVSENEVGGLAQLYSHVNFSNKCVQMLRRAETLRQLGDSSMLELLLANDVPGKMWRTGWQLYLDRAQDQGQIEAMRRFILDAMNELDRLRKDIPILQNHWTECLEGLQMYSRKLTGLEAVHLSVKCCGSDEPGGGHGFVDHQRIWSMPLSGLAKRVLEGWDLIGVMLSFAVYTSVAFVLCCVDKPWAWEEIQ